MTNKTKASAQKIECGMESHHARLALLTKKEWAYRYLGLAAKDFGQGFQMLSLCLMYLRSHLKKSATDHLHRGRHLVLGLVRQRARKSCVSPVIDKIETPNVQVQPRTEAGEARCSESAGTKG